MWGTGYTALRLQRGEYVTVVWTRYRTTAARGVLVQRDDLIRLETLS